MTNYTPTHSVSTITGLVIDGIVEYGIGIIGFAGLIALASVFIWFKKNVF